MTVMPWQRLPTALADSMRSQLPAVVETLSRAVAASPTFAEIDDAKFESDVNTAVLVALERFLDLVGTDDAALPEHVRSLFVALGAAEARDERSPDTLVAALRAAARALFRSGAQALADTGLADPEGLVDLGDAVNAYADELSAASTEGYALQVRELAGEGDRRRRLLAELLLRGNAAEVAVTAAASAVGWRTLDTVVPLLLPLDQVRDARFRYGRDGLVVDRERDVVVLLRGGPLTSRAQLAESLRGHGGVVGPELGWRAVPNAVALAERATELIAFSPSGLPGPVFVEDHLATLALRGEAEAMALLSQRRLAPLNSLRDHQRERYLETLDSWLRHWGSRPDVAAELFVHPQTVSYRLNRLRALLGDELDDPDRRFELLLVLAAARPR